MTAVPPEAAAGSSPAVIPTATASANTNIALIKYWGKVDEVQAIPATSSLSLTLGGTRTTTTVSFDGGDGAADSVTINGSASSGAELTRVSRFLDLVRSRSGITAAATVTSRASVPLAAGLASSAAGFAALATAASRAAGMDLDDRELSRLARRGSGSATRSIFGGLVRWNAGHDDASSYAEPVACEMDLAMVVVVLSKHDKLISSTRAMRATMSTSPLFPAWAEASGKDLQVALEAVRVGDLERLGEVVEGNALGMHATMMAARPGIIYWLPQTVAALHEIRAMRQEGLPVWATIDAGPNVKVLTEGARAEEVAAALRDRLPAAAVLVRRPGDGARIEDGP
ncbi:diphosphomevalonate decarboxylase [Actinomyces oris]|uniref:diphosphomevalonate decarboxylase n=1 Tax=Actinomyces oris TaxID=544580 RepID=A0A1Q8VI76_9ACTO|nr:diphosphomevalonate decarboxylase [Actinomyces oris]